jgi:phage-related protein
MVKDYFLINNTLNSFDEWGIRCVAHKFFTAPKRNNRFQIPFTNGATDLSNTRYFDDGELQITCHATRAFTAHELREIKYYLINKINISFWDELDKYYTCELYGSVESVLFPQNDNDQYIGGQFDLTFVCDPFAYGKTVSQILHDGINPMQYNGTAVAPTTIIIRNPNTTTISEISIETISRL